MIKSLKKSNTYVSPFVTFKDRTLSNVENDDLLLTEADEGVVLEFVDYGDGSGLPMLNTDCLIALEQQENDRVTVHEGLSRKGIFYPDTEPTNPDGTFKRIVHSQTKLMFFNHYSDPTKIYGLENIDFPKSMTSKFLADKIKVFNIPQRVFGDKLQESTVELVDNSLDNPYSVFDDGHNNLFAGSDLFSKQQEVGDFTNEFVTGSIDNCNSYFNFNTPDAPVSLSVSSGSAILRWINPNSASVITGYGIEKSTDSGSTYALLQLLSGDRTLTGSIDTDVINNKTYWYRLYSFNNFGTSSYSITASITFADVDAAAQASLLLWVDASTITGSSDGDFLNTWSDRSIFHNSITSSLLDSQRPKYRATAANGKPAVELGSGSFSVRNISSSFGLNSFSSSEMFIVLRSTTDPRATPAEQGPLTFNTGSNMSLPYNDGRLYEPFGSATAATDSHNFAKPTPISGTFRIYNCVSENKHKAVYYEGELIYSRDVNTVGIGNVGSHSIGRSLSGDFWFGQMAELLIYTRSLNRTERTQTTLYLANKYSKTLIADTASLTPATIPGLQGWWDASQITASLSQSQGITSVPDLSNHGRIWSQSTAANRPTYHTNSFNGLPSMKVDGNKTFVTPDFTVANNGAFTLIAVCRPTASNSSIVGSNTTTLQFRTQRSNGNVMNFFPGSGEVVSNGFPQPSASLQMFVWNRSAGAGGSITFYENGTSGGTGGNASGFTWNRIADGTVNTVPFVGEVCEIAFWTSSLSEYEQFKLYEYYFREKWGLPGR